MSSRSIRMQPSAPLGLVLHIDPVPFGYEDDPDCRQVSVELSTAELDFLITAFNCYTCVPDSRRSRELRHPVGAKLLAARDLTIRRRPRKYWAWDYHTPLEEDAIRNVPPPPHVVSPPRLAYTTHRRRTR